MTEANLFEQLDQIARFQPVWDGDLIHKGAKQELVNLKWIFRYQDKDLKIPGYKKGTGGYVLTELGKEKWNELKVKYL